MKAPSILIVEDDGLIASWLKEILKNAGYDVPPSVTSGEAALGSIRTAPPDLILMDIGLAGEIDGIETARQIRTDSAIPVIFLTAHIEMKQIPRIDGITLSGFIMKPFVEGEVLSTITKALDKKDESGDGVDP